MSNAIKHTLEKVINNNTIQYEIIELPINDIFLWKENPRLQYQLNLNFGSEITDQDIEKIIWSDKRTEVLMKQIKSDGEVYERLIVTKINNQNIVLEGNRRLVACRKLISLYPYDKNINKFSTLPVEYVKNISEKDIRYLLSSIHISGKLEWDSFEKANVIYDMLNIDNYNKEKLSSHLGLSTKEIDTLLLSHKYTKEYLDIYPSAKNVEKFTTFKHIVNSKLKDRFANDSALRKEIFHLMETDKISNCRKVIFLSQVLDNKDAYDKLKNENLDEAIKILDQLDPTISNKKFKSLQNVNKIIDKLSIQNIKNLSPSEYQILNNLFLTLQKVVKCRGENFE